MHTIDQKIGTELLLHLAKGHYYGDAILDLIPGIAMVMNENEQLNQTIHHILERRHDAGQVSQAHQDQHIEWHELDPTDKKSLKHFFDYLYFSSPSFFNEMP